MTREARRDGLPWIPPRAYGAAVTSPAEPVVEPLINLIRGAYRLAEPGTTQRALLRDALERVEIQDMNRKMAVEAVNAEIPAGTPDEKGIEHVANAIQLVGMARDPELYNAVPGGLASVLAALEARLRTADMRLAEEARAAL